MTSTRNLLALLISITVAASPTVSLWAQEAEYDEETIARVNDHFARGEEHFYDEDYPAAIREFEAANDLIPNAILMYNLSVAYERMGEEDKALEYAERAEQDGGLGPDEAAENRDRINRLREKAQEEEQAGAEGLFTPWGWVGIGLTALGGLMLVNMGLVNQRLGPQIDAYEEAAREGDASEYDRLQSDIKRRQTGGRALLVLGTLTLAGGIGLIVWDLRFNRDEAEDVDDVESPATPQVSLRVTPAPDGVFGALQISF